MKTISPDSSLENADWLKGAWDLPPYKSPEFMAMFPDLEEFRKLPAYKGACERGLICDDEWLGDWVKGGPESAYEFGGPATTSLAPLAAPKKP